MARGSRQAHAIRIRSESACPIAAAAGRRSLDVQADDAVLIFPRHLPWRIRSFALPAGSRFCPASACASNINAWPDCPLARSRATARPGKRGPALSLRPLLFFVDRRQRRLALCCRSRSGHAACESPAPALFCRAEFKVAARRPGPPRHGHRPRHHSRIPRLLGPCPHPEQRLQGTSKISLQHGNRSWDDGSQCRTLSSDQSVVARSSRLRPATASARSPLF